MADDFAEGRRYDHPRVKLHERAAGEAYHEIWRNEGQSHARPEDDQSRNGSRLATLVAHQRPKERTHGYVRQGVYSHEEGGERDGSASTFEYLEGGRGDDCGVAAYKEDDGAAQNHGQARCSRAVPFTRRISSFAG